MKFDLIKAGDRARTRPGSIPHTAGYRDGVVVAVNSTRSIHVRFDGMAPTATAVCFWDELVIIAGVEDGPSDAEVEARWDESQIAAHDGRSTPEF